MAKGLSRVRIGRVEKPYRNGYRKDRDGNIRDIHGHMECGRAGAVSVEFLDLHQGKIDDENEKHTAEKICYGLYQVACPGGQIFYHGLHAEMGAVFHPQAGAKKCQENSEIPSQLLGPAEGEMKAVPEHDLDKDKDSQPQEGQSQQEFFKIVQGSDNFGHVHIRK